MLYLHYIIIIWCFVHFLEDIGNLMSLSLRKVPQNYNNTNYLSRCGSITERYNRRLKLYIYYIVGYNNYKNKMWSMIQDTYDMSPFLHPRVNQATNIINVTSVNSLEHVG